MNKTTKAQRIIIKETDGTVVKTVKRFVTNVQPEGIIEASGTVRFSHCDWPVKTSDMFSGVWEVSF